MSSSIDLSNPGRTIHVGVILLNSVTELLDIAPVGFFSSISHNFLKDMPSILISDDIKAKALDFQIHWVTEKGQNPGHLTGNLHVSPTDSFATCPPLDIVLLGANQAGYQASDSEKEFLRKCHAECIAFLCICGGFEPTLSAGLLEGKTATAPSRLIPIMQQVAPGTKWVQKRWVRDEKIWTTGSLLNGFDMLAAFAKDTWGEENVVINDVLMEGAWPNRDVDYADVVPMA